MLLNVKQVVINDDNITQSMINVDDETSQFSTIYRKDDMPSLTIEGKGNICT